MARRWHHATHAAHAALSVLSRVVCLVATMPGGCVLPHSSAAAALSPGSGMRPSPRRGAPLPPLTWALRPACPGPLCLRCGLQPMQLLSLYPRAYLMPRFLSQKQCDHVIAMAERRLAPSGAPPRRGAAVWPWPAGLCAPGLQGCSRLSVCSSAPSGAIHAPGHPPATILHPHPAPCPPGLLSSRAGLAFKAGDTAENTRDVRTSSGTFIARQEDPDGVLAWIEDKLAAVTMIPAG